MRDQGLPIQQPRLAAVASAVLGSAALWRIALAARHYRVSLTITNDPSIRELEQVSASFELGLGVILLAHAVAAAYLVRHPLRLHGVVIVALATVTAALVAGSFLRAPVLGAPGLWPASLILAGAGCGFLFAAPWASVYLGALLGGVLGFSAGAPSVESIAVLAVAVPTVIFALIGVGLGRAARRLVPTRGTP